MPALKASSIETAVPNHSRRRVWKNPDLRSHSLLVMTFDQLHLAPLAGIPKPETVAAAEQGADLSNLLGSLATVIDLTDVRHIRLDLLTNSLIIQYQGNGFGTSRLTIVFATPEAADACFTKLWRRLGESFQLLPYTRDSWSLARFPLMVLGAALVLTFLLALMTSVLEDFAAARTAAQISTSTPALGSLGDQMMTPQSPLGILLGWLNWRVVCGIGGVGAAFAQIWLYRRLTRPPVCLELSREF